MFMQLLLVLSPAVASASTLLRVGSESGETHQLANLPEGVLAQIMLAQRPLHPIQQVSQQFYSGDVSRAAVMATLATLREDGQDWRIRANAIATLMAISKQDDEKVIAAVSHRLRNDNFFVRVIAVRSLVSLASRDFLLALLASVPPEERAHDFSFSAIVAAVAQLEHEDLLVRANAVRELVSLTTNHEYLVSVISQNLLVSSEIPYERFFLMLPLLSAPGSFIRIDPGALPSPQAVREILALLWGTTDIPRVPTSADSLLWGTAERNTVSIGRVIKGSMIEGSSRMFLNMLNRLFPAELQAAINEQHVHEWWQSSEFFTLFGRIQDVDDLISQIEGPDIASSLSSLALQISSKWLYDQTTRDSTACICGVMIIGTWPVTSLDIDLSIRIDVYFAGNILIGFI